MDNKQKIEALQAQRAEINRQIKALKNEGELIVGPCRIGKMAPPKDWWTVSYEVPMEHFGGRSYATQYRTLARGVTRDEVIDAIPDIITALQNIYDAARTETAAK